LTAVVSSVTVKIDAMVIGARASRHELLERGTAMFDRLYPVLK